MAPARAWIHVTGFSLKLATIVLQLNRQRFWFPVGPPSAPSACAVPLQGQSSTSEVADICKPC
eukprot:2895910-Prorocentrum_lima.AAC.1